MEFVFSKVHISEELKNSVRLLLLSEQNNLVTKVLERLNGNKEDWKRAQSEPPYLLKLLVEEQEKSMYALQRALGAHEEREKIKKEEEGST